MACCARKRDDGMVLGENKIIITTLKPGLQVTKLILLKKVPHFFLI